MELNNDLKAITARIIERSRPTRSAYLEAIAKAAENGPRRGHLNCSNQAHAYAGAGTDQQALATSQAPNLGIVTAYNDMLSAHQPFADFPDLIKRVARETGATAQVAGGVPAMCDGVTQSTPGMELSLFSRDVIALAAGIALSHNTFDAALYLGVCDKIVPGLIMAAASFGHIPAVFLPAGPMTSGLPNDEKAKVRQKFATGEVDRATLMQAEMAAYHGPGTCTFYGTANSNQMLMEIMGLHLPGASFVNPNTPLRDALTAEGTRRALSMTALGDTPLPVGHILDEKAFVNGLVGLMATGGSTNLVLHLPAMARAAGVILTLDDFAEISRITPLIAKVYPNGLADVNHFHAAGGMGYLIGELLSAGLLHEDVKTIMGTGLTAYTEEPKLAGDRLIWEPAPRDSLNDKILSKTTTPFQASGGLTQLQGNLGRGVIKISAVKPEHHVIEAPVRVFEEQEAVKAAFQAGEFTSDVIIVVRFQGPQANGMPELHGLTPVLSVLQGRGQQVALVTDGRMSGASGKVPAAIHISPEAAQGGPLARLRDGDMVQLDGDAGTLNVMAEGFEAREPVMQSTKAPQALLGNGLFDLLRHNVGASSDGAASVV